ncbi:MAG: BatA domain-containing protein [Phycisphaerales bacterium]
MTFMHTILAAGAALSIAIPILIHLLLRRRRKPIMWGAMRFLLEVYKKQSRKLKLQQFLLLLTRCLVIGLAGFAIARPLLSGAGITSGGGRLVVFVIDDSLASSARDASGAIAMESFKAQARQVISAMGAEDSAALITLASPARALISPPSTDLAAVRGLIEDLEPTDAGADFPGAMTLASETITRATEESKSPATVVVLSGFTEGSAALARPLPPSLGDLDGVRLIASEPSAEPSDNVRIVSIEPLRSVLLTRGSNPAAGGDVQATVTLERSGQGVGQSAVTTVRVNVASGADAPTGQPVSATARWAPGETRTSIVVRGLTAPGDDALSAGGVIIAEIDRDSIAGDNEFRRPVGVRDVLRVGIVAQRRFGRGPGIAQLQPGDWLRLALQPSDDAPIEISDIDPSTIDASVLGALDAVFVPAPDLVRDDGWDRLARFAERGGMVVVSPPPDATVHLWTDAFVGAFDLDWRLVREPIAAQSLTLSGETDGGTNADGVLSMLRSEIEDLARPVSVEKWLPFEEEPAGVEVLLSTNDNRAWMVASRAGARISDAPNGSGRGLIVYLASAPSLSWTELPASPLMVPLVQELVRQGVGIAGGSATAVAGRTMIVPAGAIELLGAQGSLSIGSGGTGNTVPPVRERSLWRAMDRSGRTIGVVAVNADPEAGNTNTQPGESVQQWLAGSLGGQGDEASAAIASGSMSWLDANDAGASLRVADEGSPVSFPMLVAALILALAEVVMARWFSHATRDKSAMAAIPAMIGGGSGGSGGGGS